MAPSPADTAMAELHSADASQRPQVAASLSRLFLRGELVAGRNLSASSPPDGAEPGRHDPRGEQA